ncbi:Vegetative incompatibility protein HET-E-1 [Trametes pubescens]|uniref:Vegetative incompatibility protein HET-E-1 n=1 Tax=Trametes pubescens TaxID=154538 RepID=A0A1M2V6W8_TRAPU|nr:Vegetative incompatibility protein HET-E-1 [Trametes pubescens]
MPRFLNTLTGEFEWYNDPRKVIYAILSHTWRASEDGGEQSFSDVQKLQDAVAEGVREQQVAVLQELQSLQSLLPSLIPRNTNDPRKGSTHSTIISHPKLSDKIKGICTVARKAGFRLIWSDACCIDKTSSAELSEAINSMYEWYRLSDMCYVYLEDVPDGDVPTNCISRFWDSRWHDRGWTLQELIAPEHVEFLTETWRFLGTKIGLASTLEKITGVNFDILTGRAPVDSVSVARRMSWAAERETTRIEDRAYSLMGIFNVHMSPIYGEGNNAFLRLQEEIIRKVPDQSIFTWGNKCMLRSLHTARGFRRFGDLPDDPGLLASSPSDFQCCRTTTPVVPSDLAARLRLNGSEDIPPLHCVFTPQGVRMHLLCLPLAKVPHVSTAFWKGIGRDICPDCKPLGKTDVLALLQCEDMGGSLVALPLYQLRTGAGNGGGSLIGTHIQCTNWRHKPFHVVRLTKEALEEALEHVTPVAMEAQMNDESNMGRWRTKFNSRSTSGRTFVHAEFIIPSNPDWEENIREVRLVRLTLERSLELSNLAIPNTKTLWMSVEASEKYRYKLLSKSGSNGPPSGAIGNICGPTGTAASNNPCEDGEAGPRASSPLTAAVSLHFLSATAF